jgi:hypothetical protein
MRLNGWQRIGISLLWLVLSGLWLAMIVSTTAQAADTTLTLACEGTTTYREEGGLNPLESTKPISMGIIIDLTARTVTGLGHYPQPHDNKHKRDHHPLWKLLVQQGWRFDLLRHPRSPDWRHGGDLDLLTDNSELQMELLAEMQANATDVLIGRHKQCFALPHASSLSTRWWPVQRHRRRTRP